MCGFAGVIAWDERYRVSRDTLAKMSARIAHRGPDGEGVYFSPDGGITPDRPQVALAHRRLAILDPDPRANQPFTDKAGRWLVYNGEIYNFRELRAELSKLQPGHEWRTNCDTEVLLAAYGQWGEKCVDRLNGMFAFAVWDEPKKALFLARDRMGQKPLYVACASAIFLSSGYALNSEPFYERGIHQPLDTVAFASEIGALTALPWFNNRIEAISLVHYLRWGYVSSAASIYEGAVQPQPGATQTMSYLKTTHTSYFYPADGRTPEAPPRHKNRSTDPASETRERFKRAVERQLVSDVPLGCLLSGGIDSSVIAASMRGLLPKSQPVLTFSIGFDDPRYDETEYAEAVAKYLDAEHRKFVVRPDAANDLPKLAEVFGEPFGDSSALPTHYLARETREYVKVALSGDGGDELFGGYDRYRAMLLASRIRMFTTPIPWKLLSPLLAQLPTGHPKARSTRIARFIKSLSLPPWKRYSSYLRLMDDHLIDQLLKPEADLELRRGLLPDFNFSTVAIVPDALAQDRFHYLPNDLLTKVDRCSMLHALEVRSPFMDHELVQFAAGLTTDQLLKGGPKRMLREAFADDLPAWVFKRKKTGFAVPIGDWFRGELRSMLRDHLFASDSFASTHFNLAVVQRLVEEHETERVDHSQRLYALLMLELWWKIAK